MIRDRVRSRLGHAGLGLLMVALAAGLLRAQTTKFEQARNDLYKQAIERQKQLGLDKNQTKLFADYPCPELPLFKPVDVAPGGSIPLSVMGKFRPNTTFLVDNDGATLTGTATATTYTGRLAMAPNQGPGFVHLYAFTPVSNGYAFVPVAFVNSPYSLDLRGTNGWTIKAVPAAKTFTVTERNAALEYRVEFYKQNETKPFETMIGRLRYDAGSAVTQELNINLEQAASGATAEMQELTKKMMDVQAFMKMSQAEQKALTDRMSALQDQMMKEMTASVSNPGAAQKKQDDFGCTMVRLRPVQSGVSGLASCGKNVGNAGTLNVTGTMALAR